jgi:hypothetical protein
VPTGSEIDFGQGLLAVQPQQPVGYSDPMGPASSG